MNDLTAPDVVCAVCGTNDHARELYPGNVRESDLNAQVFSARRSPDRLHGRILRCGQCGLVYASPLPPRELLATLYASSTYTYGDVEDTVAATYARYINRVLREMRAEGHPPRTALDIGCGNGFVLKEMLALGIPDVRGIEPFGADVRVGLHVMHAGTVLLAGPDQLARVVARPATDHDDDVGLACSVDRRGLPRLGGLADRVEEAHVRVRESPSDQADQVPHLLDRLRRLGRHAEARVLLDRAEVPWVQLVDS